jgi:hypothetical protein
MSEGLTHNATFDFRLNAILSASIVGRGFSRDIQKSGNIGL